VIVPDGTKSRAREIASETGPRPHSRTSKMTLRTPASPHPVSGCALHRRALHQARASGAENVRLRLWTIILGRSQLFADEIDLLGVAFPRRIIATLIPVLGCPARRFSAWPTDISRVVNPPMASRMSPLRTPALVPGYPEERRERSHSRSVC